MDQIEQARKEAVIIARGMDMLYARLNADEFPIVYFNRDEVIAGLRNAGIDFEIVSVGFNYFDKPKNLGFLPYEFILNSLVKAQPAKLTIRRIDGKEVGIIDIKKGCHGYEIIDQVTAMRRTIDPALLDDESRKFFEFEQSLRDKGLCSNNEDYNSGILLYVSGDQRTPEMVLEQHLQGKGYPVKMIGNKFEWFAKIPNCLEDPALSLRVSIAPDVFGSLSKRQKDHNAEWGRIVGFSGYNYGSGNVSTLCLDDKCSVGTKRDLVEKRSSIMAFFPRLDYDVLINPLKARDILREISKYVKFSKDRSVLGG